MPVAIAAAHSFIFYASHFIQLLIIAMASSVDALPHIQNTNAWAISCASGFSLNREFNRLSRCSVCIQTVTLDVCVRRIELYRRFSN